MGQDAITVIGYGFMVESDELPGDIDERVATDPVDLERPDYDGPLFVHVGCTWKETDEKVFRFDWEKCKELPLDWFEKCWTPELKDQYDAILKDFCKKAGIRFKEPAWRVWCDFR